MSVKVLKRLNSVEPRNFDNIEDFNAYYSLHKEEIDGMTTQAINKYYKIPGMHLTKIKGELKAKCITETTNPIDLIQSNTNSNTVRIEDLRLQLDNANEEIRLMKVTIKKMIKEINILKGVDLESNRI